MPDPTPILCKDAWESPEFIAFADMLGINRTPLTTSIKIDFPSIEGGLVEVTQSIYPTKTTQ